MIRTSYDEWIQAFDGKVRYLVLIGQTKEKIKAAAEKNGFHEWHREAVLLAAALIFCKSDQQVPDTCWSKYLDPFIAN